MKFYRKRNIECEILKNVIYRSLRKHDHKLGSYNYFPIIFLLTISYMSSDFFKF